jgi:hypothetical protein
MRQPEKEASKVKMKLKARAIKMRLKTFLICCLAHADCWSLYREEVKPQEAACACDAGELCAG